MKNCPVAATFALVAALSCTVAHANMLTDGTLAVPDNPALFTHYPKYEIIQITATTHPHVINDWTVSGSIDVVTTTTWKGAPGPTVVDLAGTSGLGSISQTVDNLIPGDLYQLSFELAANPSNGLHGGESHFTKWVDVSISNTATSDYYYAISAGDETVRNIQWTNRALTFIPTATSATITFAAIFPQTAPAKFADNTPFSTSQLYAGPVVASADLELLSSGSRSPGPTPPEAATHLRRGIPFVWSSASRRRTP